MLLEIVVESVEEARAAEAAGADRLELCSALAVGGLTPSPSIVQAVKRATTLPVMAMVRPRAGGFVYDAGEIDAMRRQIDAVVACGADGLVFGALRDGGGVHAGHCRELLPCCGPRPAVFHRAFDLIPDPLPALEQLIKLGFTRVLTSGGGSEAPHPSSCARLRTLIDRAAGRIEILPGGGIRPDSAAALVRATGCTQIHSSCRPPGATALDVRLVAELRRVIDAPP